MTFRGVSTISVIRSIANHYKRFKLNTNHFRFYSTQPKSKHFKMSKDLLPEHSYSNNILVLQLDAKTAFDGLNTKEKLYSHYLSKSSWYGSLIVLFQVKYSFKMLFINHIFNYRHHLNHH